MREDVEEFFKEAGCAVLRVKFSTDHETKKFKGYGYVIFGDLDSLTTAVSLSEREFMGRPLRVDYTDRETSIKHGTFQERSPFGDRPFQQRERRPRYEDDRPQSEADKDTQWRRTATEAPSESQQSETRTNPFGNMKRNFQQRPPREQQEERQELPAERPRLNLKPRTTEVPVGGNSTASSDLFGEGKAWEKPKDERIEKKLSEIDAKKEKTEESTTVKTTEREPQTENKTSDDSAPSNPFNFKKNYERREYREPREPREQRERQPREPREGEEQNPKKKSYDFSNFKPRNTQEGSQERKPRFEGDRSDRPQRKFDQPKQAEKPAPQSKNAPTNINTFDALGEENE